jgi:predicted dienelactone hydrolase
MMSSAFGVTAWSRLVPWIVCVGLMTGCGRDPAWPTEARRRSTALPVAAESSVRAASTQAADPADPGPYAIGHSSYLLFDPSRPGDRPDDATFRDTGRPIAVSIFYPVDPGDVGPSSPKAVYPLDPLYHRLADSSSSQWEPYGVLPAYQQPRPSHRGPFPVVVLSTGWGWWQWGNISLATHLASHGFVVASLYHFGDQWYPWEPLFDHVAVAAWNRPLDMSAVLTDLIGKNGDRHDPLHGVVDVEKVAAVGWSIGGFSAVTLASGDDSLCDSYQDDPSQPPPAWTCAAMAPDPRFKAVVGLDGAPTLHLGELARVHVPLMMLSEEYGELKASWPAPWYTLFARLHAAVSGHPSYRVELSRSIHRSFGDPCITDSFLLATGVYPDMANYLRDSTCSLTGIMPFDEARKLNHRYVTAFLAKTFGGDPAFRRILTPDWVWNHEQSVELFTRERCKLTSFADDWPAESFYFEHMPAPGTEHQTECDEPDDD